MIDSSNPVLRKNPFKSMPEVSDSPMTLEGAVNKTITLLGILLFAATFVWYQAGVLEPGTPTIPILMGTGFGGGLLLAIITVFKKEWSPVTAPIYAALEGLGIGGISMFFEAAFPGIVIQAVSITLAVLTSLLVAYKSGLIKATENFKLGVAAATGGIMLIYVASFVMSFFGVNLPFIHEGGWGGILFSLFVVFIAALNLIMDFDFIEEGVKNRVPSYMEWYGAFSLMVTLIWLYLEILRLLVKSRR